MLAFPLVREWCHYGYSYRLFSFIAVFFLIVMCIDHLLCSYIIAGLNMIREMIKRWWMQLKAATNKGIEPEWQRCSRYVHVQSYVMSIQGTLYWNKNANNVLRYLSV